MCSRSRACTSQLFHKIGHGKEELAERDVHAFATRSGLPVAYVKPFFASLQRAKAAAPNGPFSKGVDYETFHRFVTARESALRRVFDTLDTSALPACMSYQFCRLPVTVPHRELAERYGALDDRLDCRTHVDSSG